MLRSFVGPQLPTVLAQVRRELGDQAWVVQVEAVDGRIEVLASEIPLTAHPFQAPEHRVPLVRTAHEDPDPLWFGATMRPQDPKLTPRPAAAAAPAHRRSSIRPLVVALVGPTGAGKTTTLAKLATNAAAYGRGRVGLLGLDTYRVGAVEQLETYAQLADLQCEIIYEAHDIDRAMRRLVQCDVILVDTPGRGPRQVDDLAAVRDWVGQLEPDEVHLALPASLMPHVIRRTIQQFRVFGVTHMLCTKLDECPVDSRVFDVVAREGHTMRWYTDGQDVPGDLQPAARKLDSAKAHLMARRMAEQVFG